MKIAFFGLPIGALALAADGHELAVAVLSPVPAPGRRRLAKQGVPVLDAAKEGKNLEEKVLPRLRGVDLIASYFWTRKLPVGWLEQARLGGIGVHPSLLPRHRGPDPFFWAIDAGDAHTGVTVHELAADYDTGRILAQASLAIGQRNAWQLARALDRPALGLLRQVARALDAGPAPAAREQDEAAASMAPEPTGKLLKADFGWPTERVLRRIRALAPVPGLALEVLGCPFFVTEACADWTPAASALEPGEALVDEAAGVLVRTGDGAIRIQRAVSGEDGPVEAGIQLCQRDLAGLVARCRKVIECAGSEVHE